MAEQLDRGRRRRFGESCSDRREGVRSGRRRNANSARRRSSGRKGRS